MNRIFNLIILFIAIFLSNSVRAENVYDLFATGNKEEAIQVLRNAIDKESNSDAKYILGILYNDASSINLCTIDDFCIDENESNYNKAYEIFLDLYENENDPRAAYSIGEYYDNHWVFWPNYKKAFKYYLFAAERGVPEAQYNVANMYEFGDGVKRDLVQSVRWYLQCNKSSLCGAGKEGIDDLIEQLSPEEYALAESLIDESMKEVDIRITAARSIVLN
jgi:tetratricopeptide (TPR) repeat protein|tara:strand:+ start:53 stop:712 length:660 start_codon:yes stop_codon:yes gene_type:complete